MRRVVRVMTLMAIASLVGVIGAAEWTATILPERAAHAAFEVRAWSDAERFNEVMAVSSAWRAITDDPGLREAFEMAYVDAGGEFVDRNLSACRVDRAMEELAALRVIWKMEWGQPRRAGLRLADFEWNIRYFAATLADFQANFGEGLGRDLAQARFGSCFIDDGSDNRVPPAWRIDRRMAVALVSVSLAWALVAMKSRTAAAAYRTGSVALLLALLSRLVCGGVDLGVWGLLATGVTGWVGAWRLRRLLPHGVSQPALWLVAVAVVLGVVPHCRIEHPLWPALSDLAFAAVAISVAFPLLAASRAVPWMRWVAWPAGLATTLAGAGLVAWQCLEPITPFFSFRTLWWDIHTLAVVTAWLLFAAPTALALCACCAAPPESQG